MPDLDSPQEVVHGPIAISDEVVTAEKNRIRFVRISRNRMLVVAEKFDLTVSVTTEGAPVTAVAKSFLSGFADAAITFLKGGTQAVLGGKTCTKEVHVEQTFNSETGVMISQKVSFSMSCK